MTPEQRIRRIHRWLKASMSNEFITPTVVAVHMYGVTDDSFDWEMISRQFDKANELFAKELTWLCEYALRTGETANPALVLEVAR